VLLSRAEPALVDAQYTKNQAWKSDKVFSARFCEKQVDELFEYAPPTTHPF